MSLSMHDASVMIFSATLNNMLKWLDKAEDHAKARGFDPNNFVGVRLTPDMLPLSQQIQLASDTSKRGVARLAGVEPPKWADDENSIDELRERIQKTITYLESIPVDQVNGSEEREIIMPAGPDQTLRFTGESFLKEFALPNFYFHATMTYALLRQGGVGVGKMDFLGLS